jgi:solute:Na+ symporter, SSS family
MSVLDWLIVAAYLTYVVTDGVRRAKGTHHIEGYFLANRNLPWWAVGLSVMATQLSAITMIGTTGQGATDGMRFIQFYFGLPVAMVILGVTLVPFLHRAKVFTAYEYLERRFDAKTRSFTALLFLMSRGMSCGTIIAAPGVVFSAIFGWDLYWAVALIGVPTVIYTMIGGVQAVTWADVKQMVLIVTALLAMVTFLLFTLPVNPDAALRIAGAAGRMQVFDFSFDLTKTYTFWSGVIGGTFLMLSYFGTDQSQAQRYLTARSTDEARSALLMSAYWKIPLQALILTIGVLIFVFFVFEKPPLLFNPAHERSVRAADSVTLGALETRYASALDARRTAALQLAGVSDASGEAQAREGVRSTEAAVAAVRTEAQELTARVTGRSVRDVRDVNYIIPHFVLTVLPLGFAGVFIAAIMAAAMSATAAELNSLSTATVIDFYRRWIKPEGSDAHYLRVSKIATGFWGLFACVVATYAATLGSLIEVVNRFGSFFYGSILGVFILAMIPRARARGAFIGQLTGMAAVVTVIFRAPSVSFLWYNAIAAITVVVVGMLLSFGQRPSAVAR